MCETEKYCTRVDRECERTGYSWEKLDDSDIKYNTYIQLTCPMKHVWKSRAYAFVLKHRGCGKCAIERSKRDDLDYVRAFLDSGKFIEGTTFTRSKNEASRWEVFCPICSVDNFVVAGACNGKFYSKSHALLKGEHPCRCSTRKRMSESIARYRIDSAPNSSCQKFLRWHGEYSGSSSKFVMYCENHKEYIADFRNYVYKGVRCPGCSGKGFNPTLNGAFYILRASGRTGEFTGYGISNNFEMRLKNHRSTLSGGGFIISEIEVFYTTGKIVMELEKLVNKNFEVFPQDLNGFRTEATRYELFDDVVDFAEKYIAMAEIAQVSRVEDTRTPAQKAKDELGFPMEDQGR